jgi:hypothetical protein
MRYKKHFLEYQLAIDIVMDARGVYHYYQAIHHSIQRWRNTSTDHQRL